MPLMNISVQGLTEVSTTQKLQLGALYIESTDGSTATIKGNGERVWQYVQNGEASTAFAVGNPILRKAGTTTKIGIQSTAAAHSSFRVLGVAQHAIPAGSYGWILKRGWGSVLNDNAGSLSADSPITVSAAVAGSVKVSTVGTHEPIGWNTTALAASTVGPAYIDCPG